MPEAPPPIPPADAPALRTEDFDYHLPDQLIAQAPARPRDAARLLVVRDDGLADRGVLGGVSLGRLYPGVYALEHALLVAVTETTTEEDIERLAQELEASIKETV